MGRPIPGSTFTLNDFRQFYAALTRQAQIAIARLRAGDGLWSTDNLTLGAETEFSGIKLSNGQPYMRTAHAAQLLGPRWDPELALYNLEHGNRPVSQGGNPYRLMDRELRADVACANHVLEPLGAGLVGSGMLPSLRRGHARNRWLVPAPRFDALNQQLERRYGHVKLEMDVFDGGILQYRSRGLAIEAFTNGRQPHVSTSTSDAVAWYNAGVMTAAIVIGLSGFSPFLFGQHVSNGDARGNVFTAALRGRGGDFGTGWLVHLADIIAQCLHKPVLLPVMSGRPDEDLMELKLHLGSLYPLLRLVLDKFLRWEYRYLPSASIPDMVGNDAAAHGLNRLVAGTIEGWIDLYGEELFEVAVENYRLARSGGAEARISWPDGHGGYFDTTPAKLFLDLADKAIAELEAQGIRDASWAIDPFVRRARAGRNGSSVLLEIAGKLPGDDCMGRLSQFMATHIDIPVMDWVAG